MVAGNQRTRNLGLLPRDINLRAMTEPKPLTYDEHKAAEAAFRGYPPNADWTDSAQEIYARLSAAISKRKITALNLSTKRDLEEVG